MAKLSEVFCDMEELEYNDIEEIIKVEFEGKRLSYNNCSNVEDKYMDGFTKNTKK